jgi:hypothetical protein
MGIKWVDPVWIMPCSRYVIDNMLQLLMINNLLHLQMHILFYGKGGTVFLKAVPHSPIYLFWISHARKGSSWTLQQGTILEPVGSLRDPSCRKWFLHFIQYSCTYKCIPTCNMEYRFKSQSKSANLDWIKFFHTTVYHLYPLPVLFGKLCIVVNTQRWPLLVQILYFKKCYMINI